jgi:alkanesulfonate monooxygenase SsuD/methylene tetrahydromethanopterin reductase-like flavin-dependent oxidoreductase (luciferase family)
MEASAARRGHLPAAPTLDDATAEKMRNISVAGSPEQIVAYLNDVKKRVGVPLRLVARSHFATVPHSRQVEILDQLAEEVAPYV